MNDRSTSAAPADPADAVVAGLEPGDPLADVVERHLNQTGGSVVVDERALERAVARASQRIAAASQPPRRRGWVVVVVAAALALFAAVATLWPEPPVVPTDLGPGITATGAVSPVDGALALDVGELRFERSAVVRPRWDRIRLPRFDAELVPIGTIFEVTAEPTSARLVVLEGAVRVAIRGADVATVAAGDAARIDASGLVALGAPPVAVAAGEPEGRLAVHPTASGAPPEDPPAPSGVPADRPVLVSLLAAPEAVPLQALVAEADRVGSARPLVPLADRLDPDALPAALAPAAWLAIGRERESRGDLAEALAAYDHVPVGHWGRGPARLRRGVILGTLGESAGARNNLEEAASGRLAAGGNLALADALDRSGQRALALAAWQRAGVPSAAYDAAREPAAVGATWAPELAAIDALLAGIAVYRPVVVDGTAGTPAIRRRLAVDPALVELAAERRALSEVDPALAQAAVAAHDLAGERATREALADLSAEIRRALKPPR